MNHSIYFCRITQIAIKPLIRLLFLLAIRACHANHVVEIETLIVKDTILYCPDSNKAFTGRAVAYYANGLKKMEVELHNGRPHGKWIHWYENGQKKEVCNFHEGIRLGKSIGWDENGRKTGEIEYLEGEGNRRVIFYYDNGQKRMEAEYRQDIPHGKWVLWYENGNMEEEFYNRNGQRHGTTTVWYENGQKKAEGEYRDDLWQGKWMFWDAEGKLREELNFLDGEVVSRIEYDEHGNKVESPPVAAEASAIPHENIYVFAKSGLSVPRQIETLHLIDETEYQPDGTNVGLQYHDPEKWLDISLYVYESPPGTKGPFLLLNSEGKPILEDQEEIIKRPNAVFKLTQPSDSYLKEYKRTLNSISAKGYTRKTESRVMAVPTRDDSPIAYAANLTKIERIEEQEIQFFWKTHLYSIPGFFVKIHCTFPEALWLEVGAIDIEFIQAINWNEILPGEDKKILDDAQQTPAGDVLKAAPEE
ncbi:MAG: toxin-antitoxin system YwqK family antitoxin [Candidatus Pacebacteria bacterium]|nr:toxin-antitoxin system YwqK family antitoxin [Candidatus Paceibacterota bacterium]